MIMDLHNQGPLRPWIIMMDHDHGSRSLHALSTCRPFVVSCVIKTWVNAWFTSDKLHEYPPGEYLPCLFGCKPSLRLTPQGSYYDSATDALPHYMICKPLWSHIVYDDTPEPTTASATTFLALRPLSRDSAENLAAAFWVYNETKQAAKRTSLRAKASQARLACGSAAPSSTRSQSGARGSAAPSTPRSRNDPCGFAAPSTVPSQSERPRIN